MILQNLNLIKPPQQQQQPLNTTRRQQILNADLSREWKAKLDKNRQLLMLMHKLQQMQESLWGKFFRFEKSELFVNFQKRFTFKQVFRLRIDDIIYFCLLLTICIVFALLPSQTVQSTIIGTLLVQAYRYMLSFLILFSAIWLISSNWYRHFVFGMVCVLFPLLTLLTYYGVIPFDQIDTSASLFTYLHILSLWVVYGALYIVYPIKQFVRNKIGSLYSYLYALSTLTLFLIWPAYSLIQELAASGQITFNFITQNQALIITFLAIVVFTFHLFVHQTFFQGNLSETKRVLLTDFNKGQLTEALGDMEAQLKNLNERPFLYRNYTAYTRIMSIIVFAFTLAIEVYVFLYLATNLSQIYRSIAVMLFCICFNIYGCIMNLLPISRQSVLFFFSILSLIPAGFSPLYCSTCSSNPFTYYEYIFMATTLPYTTIFWSVVRSLSRRRPFLRLNLMVIMYIFIHIPLMLFMINSLGMISVDQTTTYIFNVIVLGIVGLVAGVGLIGFIVWLCVSVRGLPKQEAIGAIPPIDYNYYQQGNPPYIPYTKKQSFSLSWLSSLDIRNLAQLFNCINFLLAQLATMYIFNQINTGILIPQSTTSKYVIYAQFYIVGIFFMWAYSYIVFQDGSDGWNIVGIVGLGVLGIFGITFSYVYQVLEMFLTFRIAGGVSLALSLLAIALHIVKNNNKDIMSFLSGILVIMLWLFLIQPYVQLLPIAPLYLDPSLEGTFIYACILGTTLLLIVLVSVMSIVFNMLMGKFEEEKKIKFMTEDVETYLREEGIETEDQVLHILYESYENRDEKYIFFLKRGYPIRTYKDPTDKDTPHKTVVYNHETLNRKESLTKIPQDEKPQDYCWLCLTCCCGVDEGEMENKVGKVAEGNVIGEDEMEELMPEDFFKQVFVRAVRKQEGKNERKNADMSKLYSSKSIILRHLTSTNKHLGQQYTILKTKKNYKLANELWHLIFTFLANEDDPPAKIIFNDFLIFCSIVDIGTVTKNDINRIFLDYAAHMWKGNIAGDIGDFSILVEELTRLKYANIMPSEDNKYKFLLECVYPNLCEYAQFQDVMNQRRISTTKKASLNNASNIGPGNEFSENFSSIRSGALISGFAGKSGGAPSLYSLSEEQLDSSPFLTSFQRHQKQLQKIIHKKQKIHQNKISSKYDKLIQPAKQQIIQPKIKKQQKLQKSKSCKLTIYQKYQSCKNCCKKIQEEQVVIKRKNVKPWEYLAVESIRIMEHKDQEWKEQKKEKEYQFRLILNNFLIAIFKLADLYTFMEITIMNPETGWQSARSFSILTLQYRTQLYISFAVVLLCGGLGIKGITYIFEDRLGLTETRIPAVFPHPMFFFTFIYKLLILSLFNTVIMTLFSTFMCDWTSSTTPYMMILEATDVPVECFGAEHNIYVICSIVCILLYYPLSAYTMPNFQFAEKRLDLKYKPSYLIIYFQVNFILAAGKVLLSQMTNKTQQIQTVQILFQSINIFCIAFLGLMVIILRPCLISWFNIVEFLVIWIGLCWNVLGLVLYLTGEWLVCVVVGCTVSGVSIVVAVVVIRRRFFGGVKVEDEVQANDIKQLQLAWKYRKEYNVDLARLHHERSGDKEQYTDNGEKANELHNISNQPLIIAQPGEVITHSGSNKIIQPAYQFMEGGK